MGIEDENLSPKIIESGDLPNERQADQFSELVQEILEQVSLINAVEDELDKNSKLNALDLIKELKITTDIEKRKNLVSDLEGQVAMINVWHGDKLDKDAKDRARELIARLKK